MQLPTIQQPEDLLALIMRARSSFLVRCVLRFVTIQGFDRAIVISSQAFTALIPLFILFGVGGFLYAMTRLPRYAERISVPLLIAVVGPFLILPNLGYNEWGHAFWMTEELFSAPLHWGFVVLGWSLLAAGGVIYSLGVLIYISRALPYRRAIWHGFVIVAAGSHYAAVLTGVVLVS